MRRKLPFRNWQSEVEVAFAASLWWLNHSAFNHEIWMLRNLRKLTLLAVYLILLWQVLPLVSLKEDSYWAEEGTQGVDSRAYWMLNPSKYAKLNREGKSYLEACVARMGLASEVRLRPHGDGHLVEVEVVNRLNVAISGLVVEPHDSRLKALGLDGRTLIAFETLSPGERVTCSETVSNLVDLFPTDVSFGLTARDVVNENGVQVVEYVYWSHWPMVSSRQDLLEAQGALCGV